MKYWLVHRDPYNGLLWSLSNWVVHHPLYNPTNQEIPEGIKLHQKRNRLLLQVCGQDSSVPKDEDQGRIWIVLQVPWHHGRSVSSDVRCTLWQKKSWMDSPKMMGHIISTKLEAKFAGSYGTFYSFFFQIVFFLCEPVELTRSNICLLNTLWCGAMVRTIFGMGHLPHFFWISPRWLHRCTKVQRKTSPASP